MPLGARSRGCEACQRRKIKCDGRMPSCGKCERLGIECSGPKVGPIILQFDPQKKLQTQQRNGTWHILTLCGNFCDHADVMPQASSTATKNITDSHGSSISSSQSLTPFASHSIRAISDSRAMKDWFALKLQETVAIPHLREQSIVPELVKWAGSNEYPLLQRAVWATSAALNGAASNTPGLIKKAQEIYAGALKNLLSGISETATKDGYAPLTTAQPRNITIEMVAVAALFVWYEAIIGTDPNGWMAHSFGAGSILLRRPPEDYRLGLGHKVFRSVRYMIANVGVLTIQYTPFGYSPWLDIPFSLTVKTSFDRLTDFMLVIPNSLSWLKEKFAAGLPILNDVEGAKVLAEVRMLEQRLADFLLTYDKEMINAGEMGLFLDMSQDWVDSTGEYHPKTRNYPSDEIAECLIHYEMCRLLIALMKAAFSDANSFVACRAEALEHSASVLSGIAYAESRSTTKMVREHFGFLCILITILVASPSEKHREYAKLKIGSWGGGNGLVGASPSHAIVRWKSLNTIWEKMAKPPDNIKPLANLVGASNV